MECEVGIREQALQRPGCQWVMKVGNCGVGGGGGAYVVSEATNQEDKWKALTFLCSQRAGHFFIPSSDSPFIPLLYVSFIPSLFSLYPSLFLIWSDWRRNAALLKVAAEEQWGIVPLHTHTHTKAM